MLDYKQRLDNAMLQLQFIIDEDYEDNDNDNHMMVMMRG